MEIGIKIWMLTGDNPFTAVNIGYSCGLIEKKQKSFIINETDPKLILKQLKKIKKFIYKKFNTSLIYDANREKNKSTRGDFCIVITGDALTIIQKYCESYKETANNNNNNNLNESENSNIGKKLKKLYLISFLNIFFYLYIVRKKLQ